MGTSKRAGSKRILIPAAGTAGAANQHSPDCRRHAAGAVLYQKSQALCSKPKRGQGALQLEAVPPQGRGLGSVWTLTGQDVASSVTSVVAQHAGSAHSTPHIMMLFNSFRQGDSPSDVVLWFRLKPIQAVQL